MITYMNASRRDMENLMSTRLEMLREVNDLSEDYTFPDNLVDSSRLYFEDGNQTTILAMDGRKVVGCASVSYIEVMPTFAHPTGKRGHIMNVYTKKDYRGQGIARHMMELLINEAKLRGVTELILDTTESGRALYHACGFTESKECMVFIIDKKDKNSRVAVHNFIHNDMPADKEDKYEKNLGNWWHCICESVYCRALCGKR